MSVFTVQTPGARYPVHVDRGALRELAALIPARAGRVFTVTTADVWRHHGAAYEAALGGRAHELLFFPGGEERKRMAEVEALAESMVERGGDRSSLVIAFGGGIVNDLGGFTAAIFMRGIPVIQIPTTLLAQVDAAVGGKTGANLTRGKNLVGSFHQPLGVIVDPTLLATLPERELRAGLAEVIKCGVIRSPRLFRMLALNAPAVLARDPAFLDDCIAESVRIKCEVVSADEREGGLRRILNFGHTIGHAIEAETGYARYLHGEAVALGMRAATRLAHLTGHLSAEDSVEILDCINAYGPWPAGADLDPRRIFARLGSDKKAVQGTVHFVLPVRIGETTVVSGLPEKAILEATQAALA